MTPRFLLRMCQMMGYNFQWKCRRRYRFELMMRENKLNFENAVFGVSIEQNMKKNDIPNITVQFYVKCNSQSSS